MKVDKLDFKFLIDRENSEKQGLNIDTLCRTKKFDFAICHYFLFPVFQLTTKARVVEERSAAGTSLDTATSSYTKRQSSNLQVLLLLLRGRLLSHQGMVFLVAFDNLDNFATR